MVRVRFAPSPTGHLHVGNARTAVFNYLYARHSGGKFILRIENTDIERDVEGAEEIIYEDLRWLGVSWDEGPDIGGPYGPYRQSERVHLYRYYANLLLSAGSAYYCFCSSETLEEEKRKMREKGEVPRYSGKCSALDGEESRRKIAAGEEAAVRFRLDRLGMIRDLVRGEVDFSSKISGDPVIMRQDGRPTYNFAVVVDDAFMRITHVLRGEDHLSNTPLQVKLYDAIKRARDQRVEQPPFSLATEPSFDSPLFAHLSMILGSDGSRLSKRHGAASVSYFRDEGYLPEAFFNYLSLLGWSLSDGRTIATLEEMIQDFEIERVSKAPAIFDEKKLNWMNASHIKSSGAKRILPLALEYLKSEDCIHGGRESEVDAWVSELLELHIPGLENVRSIVRLSQPIFRFEIDNLRKREEERKILLGENSMKVLKAFEEKLLKEEITTGEQYRALIARLKEQTKVEGKDLFRPLRVAVSLSASGPELNVLIPLIERGARLKPALNIPACLERVRQVIRFFSSESEKA